VAKVARNRHSLEAPTWHSTWRLCGRNTPLSGTGDYEPTALRSISKSLVRLLALPTTRGAIRTSRAIRCQTRSMLRSSAPVSVVCSPLPGCGDWACAASGSSTRPPTWAAPGTGTGTRALRVTSSRMSTCRCWRSWAIPNREVRQRRRDLRALSTHRRTLRSVSRRMSSGRGQ
jgi:hypothetical protein